MKDIIELLNKKIEEAEYLIKNTEDPTFKNIALGSSLAYRDILNIITLQEEKDV